MTKFPFPPFFQHIFPLRDEAQFIVVGNQRRIPNLGQKLLGCRRILTTNLHAMLRTRITPVRAIHPAFLPASMLLIQRQTPLEILNFRQQQVLLKRGTPAVLLLHGGENFAQRSQFGLEDLLTVMGLLEDRLEFVELLDGQFGGVRLERGRIFAALGQPVGGALNDGEFRRGRLGFRAVRVEELQAGDDASVSHWNEKRSNKVDSNRKKIKEFSNH